MSTAKMPQAQASSLKLSRRSACDRCKAYKLKCLRDGSASEPCQRCAKADLACTTTIEQPSMDAASQPKVRNSDQQKASVRQVQSEQQRPLQRHGSNSHAVANGAALHDSGPRLLPRNHQQQNLPRRQAMMNRHRLLPRQTSAPQLHNIQLNTSMGSSLSDQFSMALETSSPLLADPILSQEDLDMLIADYVPNQMHADQDTFMAFGFDDEQTLGPPTNSSLDGSVNYSDLSKDFNGTKPAPTASPDAAIPTVEAAQTGLYDNHRALINLQLELIHDQEKLNRAAKLPHPPGHNPLKCSTAVQHHPINRLLNQTARFWEVIRAMCIDNTRDSADSEVQTDISPSSTNEHVTAEDHILLVTMVATYVTLLRSCRQVFARIYAGFELATTDPSVSLKDASLPKLQFGELEIENSLYIQVNVLIELMSSMLQRIASALQISSPASTNNPSSSAASEYCLPFWTNPTAVLLKDSILAQERAQTCDFCLAKLMIRVKDILKDHRE